MPVLRTLACGVATVISSKLCLKNEESGKGEGEERGRERAPKAERTIKPKSARGIEISFVLMVFCPAAERSGGSGGN